MFRSDFLSRKATGVLVTHSLTEIRHPTPSVPQCGGQLGSACWRRTRGARISPWLLPDPPVVPAQAQSWHPAARTGACVCLPAKCISAVGAAGQLDHLGQQIVLSEVNLAAHEADCVSSAFSVVICSSFVYGSTDLSVPTPSLCLCGDTKPARGSRYERLVAWEGQRALNVPMKVAITRY